MSRYISNVPFGIKTHVKHMYTGYSNLPNGELRWLSAEGDVIAEMQLQSNLDSAKARDRGEYIELKRI